MHNRSRTLIGAVAALVVCLTALGLAPSAGAGAAATDAVTPAAPSAPAAPAAPAAPSAPSGTPPSTSTQGTTTWVAPAARSSLSGVVSLIVRSTDSTVQFSIDGEVLATATVSDGTAQLRQSTTPFQDGSHTLVAKGCDTDVIGIVTCDTASLGVAIDNSITAVTGGGTVGPTTPTVPLDDATTYTDVDSFAVGGTGYGLVKITPVVAAGSGVPGALYPLPLQLPLSGLTGRLTVTACPTTAAGRTCSGGTTQQVITVLSTAPVLMTPAAALVGPRRPLVFGFALAVGESVALQVHRGGAIYQRIIGSFPAGKSSYSWDGRMPGRMPDGPASVQLVRLGGGGISVVRRVTVEVHDPAITRVRAPRSFTPGAGRAFRAAVTTDRPSQARLLISRDGHLVATTAWTATSGSPAALWSGVLGGRTVTGSYRYVVQLRDAAGNVASSRPASLTLA